MRMGRIAIVGLAVGLAVGFGGCAGLAPPTANLPPELASYLAGDWAAFTVFQRPAQALDLPPTAATVKVRELHGVVGFKGTPSAPVYGHLSCSGVECPDWFGGPQPVTAWLVWYPADRAFVFVDARTGVMLRAAVMIRGSGEWSVVL
jgi:hypothetical protein